MFRRAVFRYEHPCDKCTEAYDVSDPDMGLADSGQNPAGKHNITCLLGIDHLHSAQQITGNQRIFKVIHHRAHPQSELVSSHQAISHLLTSRLSSHNWLQIKVKGQQSQGRVRYQGGARYQGARYYFPSFSQRGVRRLTRFHQPRASLRHREAKPD